MPNEKFESASHFSHTPRVAETRLLIQSVCKKCGAAKVVSAHDNSLQRWEDGHHCAQGVKAGDEGP